MIVPTAEFDPMFAEDGVPFRSKMCDYIRREFADLLGPHAVFQRLGADRELEELSAVASPAERQQDNRQDVA